MTIELLQTLSKTAFVLAGIFFAVAILLFFVLHVPQLIGELSGITARKGVEAIRKQNETSGNKAYKPSKVNAERGKLTDKITASGQLKPRKGGNGIGAQTEKIATYTLASKAAETTLLDERAQETTLLETCDGVLRTSEETGETTVLSEAPYIGETTVLSGEAETTILSTEQVKDSSDDASDDNVITMDVEMGFAESPELIE